MDYVSLSYVLAFIYIVNFVVLYYLYGQNKNIKGLKYWFISSIIGVFAFFSVFLKPWIGDYTAFFNNGLILTGFIFLLEGVFQFREFKHSPKRKYIGIVLILIAFTISFINVHDATSRYLMYDLFLSSLLIALPITLLYKQKNNFNLYLVTSVFSLLLAVPHIIRWVLAYNGVIRGYDGIHPIISYAYFAGIAFSFIWVINIMLIIQSEYIKKLQFLSGHDQLTGLLNRRSFEQDLARYFENLNENEMLSIIDIDRFKDVNDEFGHQFGDSVIIEMSKIITNLFPNGDFYRIGGDEFALVTRNKKSKEIKAKIDKHLSNHIVIESQTILLSLSIGSLEFKSFDSLEELYKSTDKAMYMEKKKNDLLRKSLKK